MGVGPFFPFSDELLQLFRLLGCKVVALGSVVRNEIEFPFVGYLVANGFPVVPPDVAVISMFAEDVFVELLVGMTDGWHQACSCQRNDVVAAVIGLWIGCSSHIDEGCHEVGDVADVIPQLRGVLLRLLRPRDDERRCYAAFVGTALVLSVGRVAHHCPRLAIRGLHPMLLVVDVAHVSEACLAIRLSTRSVVGKEDDEGIVELSFLLEVIDDTANVVVHAMNLCGIDRHAKG